MGCRTTCGRYDCGYGRGTMVPDELIPRCPHCGAEMFPWVRGYGNFLQGKKYEEEYEKISKYIQKNKDRKILFIELGVGRMTPMFIQEPFWELTNSLKDAYYISVNSEYQFCRNSLKIRDCYFGRYRNSVKRFAESKRGKCICIGYLFLIFHLMEKH